MILEKAQVEKKEFRSRLEIRQIRFHMMSRRILKDHSRRGAYQEDGLKVADVVEVAEFAEECNRENCRRLISYQM